MREYLDNAKTYVALMRTLGTVGVDTIQISEKKLKELSEYFEVKAKVRNIRDLDLDNRYHDRLIIEGVTFVACSDWDDAQSVGVIDEVFDGEVEIWG